MTRPHVLLSVAVSLDGYIDDRGAQRFPLSNAEDFDHVDQARAESDAILVGAATIRRDNPRLLVRHADRRAARVAAGRPEHPLKVTVTGSGDLDRTRAFWQDGAKLVYTAERGHGRAVAAVGDLADVVPLGPSVDFGTLLDDLGARNDGASRILLLSVRHVRYDSFPAWGYIVKGQPITRWEAQTLVQSTRHVLG